LLNSSIKTLQCSKGLGFPSGHSTNSTIFAFLLFLDLFHGKTARDKHPLFANKFVYLVSLVVALFWAGMIPFSRYALGVHSMDQIVCGACLGTWAAFSLHFVVRDHLLAHIERVIDFSNGESEEVDERAALLQEQKQLFKPLSFAIGVIALHLSFISLSIYVFYHDAAELDPTKEPVLSWKKTYEKNCGKIDLAKFLYFDTVEETFKVSVETFIYLTFLARASICQRYFSANQSSIWHISNSPNLSSLGSVRSIFYTLIKFLIFAALMIFNKYAQKGINYFIVIGEDTDPTNIVFKDLAK
jgi:hypothetical protein